MLLDSGWPGPLDGAYGGSPAGGDVMCARCVKSVELFGDASSGVYEINSMHCLYTSVRMSLAAESRAYTYSERDMLMDTMLVILAIGSTQTISRIHVSSEAPSICEAVSICSMPAPMDIPA